MQDERLPKNCVHGGIIYELEANRIKLRELAGLAHDAVAMSLNTAIGLWSTNIGSNAESLRSIGSGRIGPITTF